MNKILKIIVKILVGIIGLFVVFFLIMYFATMGDYPVAKTVAQAPGIPHIVIDDVVFHAETFGTDTNQVVVVIHGGPGNDYRSLLPLKALSDKYFVVFYDQRGAGLSPRVNAEELSLESSLEDLDKIVNFYSPGKKVNLIGHSWGGMLASGYIAKHPEKVNKAVLAEPGMLTTEQAKKFSEVFQIELTWSALKTLVRIWFESLHIDEPDDQASGDYFFQTLVSSDFEGNPMRYEFCNGKVDFVNAPVWRISSVSSQAIQEKGLGEDGELILDLVSGLENFNNKVMFLCGSCNQIIGPDYQKEQMKFFSNAEMVVIENAGHFMIADQPEKSVETIWRYFNE